MLDDQRFELAHDVAVTREREVGLDPILGCREAKLLEPRDLALRKRLVREVGQGGTAPERERFPERAGSRLRIAASERIPALLDQALEPAHVDLVGLCAEEIAGAAGEQHTGPKQLAQLGDVVLHDLRRGFGRLVAPELVDQLLARDDLVRVQEQNGQEGLALFTPEAKRPFVLLDHERSKDAEPQRHLFTFCTAAPPCPSSAVLWRKADPGYCPITCEWAPGRILEP